VKKTEFLDFSTIGEFQQIKPQYVNLPSNKAVEIQCGLRHSLIKASDGKIYAFGDNSSGQIL
jgi:alpha-tubulin suppressor-like RCC1 family protein